MLLCGRLRLGVWRRETRFLIWNLPTQGVWAWNTWFQKAATEVTLHLDSPCSKIADQAKFSWIPIYHAYLTYLLSCQILDMETQNGYRTTSPSLAFFLSIVPPLAAIYLQKSLNLHWNLHTSHEASRHFPMQKLENTTSKISSVSTAPNTVARLRVASKSSNAIISS